LAESHELQGILGDAGRAQFLAELEFLDRLSVFELSTPGATVHENCTFK